ncbi:Galactoside 3(4)-L-fucosyltransferase [Mactra antiquata]
MGIEHPSLQRMDNYGQIKRLNKVYVRETREKLETVDSVRNKSAKLDFVRNGKKVDDFDNSNKRLWKKRKRNKIDVDSILKEDMLLIKKLLNEDALENKLTEEMDEVPSRYVDFVKHGEFEFDDKTINEDINDVINGERLDFKAKPKLVDENAEYEPKLGVNNVIEMSFNSTNSVNNTKASFKYESDQSEVAIQDNDFISNDTHSHESETMDKSMPLKCRSHVVKIPPKEPSGKKMEPSMKKKRIIWYDVPHHGHGLRNSVKNAKFNKCPPAARNCEILPHRLTTAAETVIDTGNPLHADAVIMHGCHLNGIPKLIRRHQDQVFVLAERENWYGNTTYTFFNDSHTRYFNDKFNWTMTYRRDSDIYMPYGHIVFTRRYEMKNYQAIFSRKKYSVAWMVSHCSTMSHREDYVRELQKYIDVHIYGACGSYTCDKNDHNCLKTVIKTYKFVLSFENTYHTNYVTEKLFNWFPENIIPVVRGGETDYAKLGVPAGSIINADDFESPKELAKMLWRVGSNEKLYSRYLKRKAGYQILSKEIMQERAYCDLCKKLNNLDSYRQYYTHVGAWFSSDLNSATYCLE